MKHEKLRRLIFMALCCDLGIFAKKLILPAANILTDSLHIPGGVGTSFSLMFLIIAAVFIPRFGCATLMGLVQSGIALCMGTVGSMGALAPVGYIVPGFAIDCMLLMGRKLSLGRTESMVIANAAAAVTACLAANLIVFRLQGIVLALYVCVSALSGTVCGFLGDSAADRLKNILGKDDYYEKKTSHMHSSACTADGSVCRNTSDNPHV